MLGLSLAWWFVERGFEPVITGVASLAGLLSTFRRGPEDGPTSAVSPGLPARVDGPALSFAATLHTVGRRDSAEALTEAFEEVSEGRGKMVCVTGEAGIGKTTVAENFMSKLSEQVALISGGRCSERLAGTEAYLPLLEALESLLRGVDGETTSELMIRTAPSWYRQLGPQYESALGRDSPASSSQESLKREMAVFLEHLTRDRPLVLFLEDLHWADVSTVDVLTYIADRFDRTKILVLVTYRPEDMRLSQHAFLQVRPTLEQRGMLTEIPLGFLGAEDIDQYLALEFPGHSFPDEFSRAVKERTEGSPHFVVALLSTLKDQDTIVKEGASWTLSRTVDDVADKFPSSLASAIEAKIARLTKPDRELLGLAAVQGYRFDAAVIAHVDHFGDFSTHELDEIPELGMLCFIRLNFLNHRMIAKNEKTNRRAQFVF